MYELWFGLERNASAMAAAVAPLAAVWCSHMGQTKSSAVSSWSVMSRSSDGGNAPPWSLAYAIHAVPI